MKVLICGSRFYNNYNEFSIVLNQNITDKDIIISGGARGADFMAERYARDNNIIIEIYQADWRKYGKAAGPIRNRQMLDNIGVNDKVIAFWDGVSRGTKNMIDIAKEKGVNVIIKYIN